MEMLKSDPGWPSATASHRSDRPVVGRGRRPRGRHDLRRGPQSAASTTEPRRVAPAWPGYADLVEKVMPAVVSVTTKRNVSERDGRASPRATPASSSGSSRNSRVPAARCSSASWSASRPWRSAVRGHAPLGPRGEMPMAGAGTGFIFDDDGHIATNNHVVDGADEITVTLHDGREFKAEVVGTDPGHRSRRAQDRCRRDAARTSSSPTSDKVRVGDPVIAIGNPFGLGDTVTAGIVSAEHRMIGAGRYDDFLQIDAPINRGNSGGPTFNLEGKVIGDQHRDPQPDRRQRRHRLRHPREPGQGDHRPICTRTARSSAAGSACISRRSTRIWPRASASTMPKGALVAAGHAGQPGGRAPASSRAT